MSQPEANAASPRYAWVFAALVLLTALEVGASYLPAAVRLPILLVFALAKALLVVLHFMHLRHDSRIYAGLLLIGLLLVSLLILLVSLVAVGA
jgi:cytochrome c oxidase subunit IV